MKVSVAICTYNGEKFIEKQLRSICLQSRKVDEIMISDDGSKDNTLVLCEQILSEYDIPYQIIKNKVALRVMKNFEQCFSLCQGDVIFSCDQDDIWESNKVEIMMQYFEKDNNLSMIATNATLIDANDQVMNLTLKDSIGFDHQDMLASLLRTFCITGATMAFRKDFQQEHFFASAYWLHDGWLALLATLQNRFLFLEQPLTQYRLHGNNECGVGDVDILQNGTLEQLTKRKHKRMKKTALGSPYYFQDYTKERYAMYQEVVDQIQLHDWKVEENNLAALQTCIQFWKQRSALQTLSWSAMQKMRKTLRQANAYRQFCESSWFYYFDLYFWIVYKILPRKKK